MKNILVSALILGGFAALAAPAQSQVIVNSTSPNPSATGAATISHFNGATVAIAVEITGNAGESISDALFEPTYTATTGLDTADMTFANATLTPTFAAAPAAFASFEGEAAAALDAATTATDLNAQVSLIRAWRSGGLN